MTLGAKSSGYLSPLKNAGQLHAAGLIPAWMSSLNLWLGKRQCFGKAMLSTAGMSAVSILQSRRLSAPLSPNSPAAPPNPWTTGQLSKVPDRVHYC